MINWDDVRKSFSLGRVRWRRHALSRMLERGILRQELKEIIEHGEIIEEYASSKPYPSCLIHGVSSGRPLHVVAAWDEIGKYVYIISAYEPDEEHFMPDLKTRKKDES